MYGADMFGHEACLCQVGSTLQAYGKAVQARPVGACLRVVLDAMLAELLGEGGDDAAVETSGEEHAVRHVGHELSLHGGGEGIADGFDGGWVVLHGIKLHPVALVVLAHAALATPVVMAGQEGLVALALAFEGFQLRGYIDGSVVVVANSSRSSS